MSAAEGAKAQKAIAESPASRALLIRLEEELCVRGAIEDDQLFRFRILSRISRRIGNAEVAVGVEAQPTNGCTELTDERFAFSGSNGH